MTIIIISIIFLLMLSAFFSGSETGLTSASRAKIHKLKIEGNKRAVMVSNLRKKKDRLIGTILLGNNAVNISASALATSIAIPYFGDDGILYATLIMTLLVLIFAEIMPKTYAFRNAERIALIVAPVFIVLNKLFLPITLLVQIIVDIIMKLFGIKGGGEENSEIEGTDALRGAIALHHDEGAVIKSDRDMLGGILDLSDTEVWEIMLHRKEMKTMDIGEPPEKIVEYVLSSPYMRIPLWKDNPDNIVGVLHGKSLMSALQKSNCSASDIDIPSIIKKPWFVPETRVLSDQLRAFREKHNHFALVVDEYGALLGLVTLEDILEEIVGQIDDEYDINKKNIRKHRDGSYTIIGSTTIRDLNRELDWNLPDEEVSTIAGLVMHEAQIIPDVKQIFSFYGYRFEIRGKQNNQITSIRMRKL